MKTLLERLSAVVEFLDRIDDVLPAKYQVITHLLQAMALKDGLDKGVEHFRSKQARAARKGKALDAIAAAFRAELASEEAQRVFFRNQGSAAGSPTTKG